MPDSTIPLVQPSLAQVGERIMLFGGFIKGPNVVSNNIFELICKEGIGRKYCYWTILSQKLRVPRVAGIAIPMP